jgi:hypothetical protein
MQIKHQEQLNKKEQDSWLWRKEEEGGIVFVMS